MLRVGARSRGCRRAVVVEDHDRYRGDRRTALSLSDDVFRKARALQKVAAHATLRGMPDECLYCWLW